MAPSDFFPLPELPQDLQRLEQWLSSREAAQPGIRPDNQARIVWHDPSRLERTRYSIVYLHGFTASQGEGDPQHRRLAEALQGNLYLPRLPGHGLSEDGAMRGIRAEYWIEAATEALAIGHTLGEQASWSVPPWGPPWPSNWQQHIRHQWRPCWHGRRVSAYATIRRCRRYANAATKS